jgi:hypothetical protein
VERAAVQGPARKIPAESIDFKDLPAEGKAQMAAQAGIRISAAGVREKTESR